MSLAREYAARVLGCRVWPDWWSSQHDDFLARFSVHGWSPSTAAPGTYRAGSCRNCVYSQDSWAAAVVLASVESPRPTEELLALASLLLCSGEAEFIVRWQPPGEGSP